MVLLARVIFLVLMVAGQVLPASAEPPSREPTVSLKLTAVGTDDVPVRTGLSMDIACNVRGVARIAQLAPPQNGTLREIERENHPGFGIGNPRWACNKKKVKTTVAVYRPNPGFLGTDRFIFFIVYYNGQWTRFDVEMTVWRQ